MPTAVSLWRASARDSTTGAVSRDPDPLVAQAAAEALCTSVLEQALLFSPCCSPNPQARLLAALVLSRMQSAYF
jgi:hypothetical protein